MNGTLTKDDILYVFKFFVSLKAFYNSALFFINSLFKTKSVLKLTWVSIKISQINFYSFSFKLNEKVPLKIWFEEEVRRKFLLEGKVDL